MESVVFKFLLLLLYCASALSLCPEGIQKWCSCEEYSIGFYIKCSRISTDLNTIVHSIGKLRIARLTITQVSWPEIKKVSHSSIRALHLVDCRIEKIEQNAFGSLSEHLEELILANNSLTLMPLFGPLPNLTTLNLNHNKLSDIPESSLDGAPNLRTLRLQGNNICELSKKSLNETKEKLELLDLSGNCLSRVPAQNLRNALKLLHLDLSDNKILAIDNFELMNLPLLKELRLSRNQVTRIAPMALMNVPKMQNLYLHNNLLTYLGSTKLFQVFKDLEMLDLSYNRLTKVPTLKELPNIRQVRLDYNKIERIDTLTFSSNPNLQLISLQNNAISTIARNSFDSLDQLTVLLLGNNMLTTIDRGMLDGMRNLQQLSLKNNSLCEIRNKTFDSVSMLTMLDLSNNKIRRMPSDVFDSVRRLFWLDLSNDELPSFEKGTFKTKIANILLHGNPLVCDDKLDWFLEYLVVNKVRTFLPSQADIVCSGPEKIAGTRLKELMMKKANETMHSQKNIQQSPNLKQNLLLSLLPALGGTPSTRSGSKLPAGIAQSIDAVSSTNVDDLSSVDIRALIQSMPDTVITLPVIGNVDMKQLPPNLISHVLHGGQIPGIPKEMLDAVVAEYTKKVRAALQAQGQQSAVLLNPQLSSGNLMNITGQTLLQNNQRNNIFGGNYSTSAEVLELSNDTLKTGLLGLVNGMKLPPQLLQLIKLLPPNYDITKIPNEVMQAVSRNELPDFGLLPPDLQQHLINNIQSVVTAFSDKPNVTIDELLKKLPKFDRPALPTFAPYNIDDVRSDLTHAELQNANQRRIQLCTVLLLSLIGVISIVVLAMLCVYMKRKRRAALERGMEKDSLVNTFHMPPPQAASSPKIPEQFPAYLFPTTNNFVPQHVLRPPH